MNKSDDHVTVESAASVALNSGTMPMPDHAPLVVGVPLSIPGGTLSPEAAVSIALNKGTLPDYGVGVKYEGPTGPVGMPGPRGQNPDGTPGETEEEHRQRWRDAEAHNARFFADHPPAPGSATYLCYLCGGKISDSKEVNWRGHWICPGCFEKESVSESVHPKLSGPKTAIEEMLGPDGMRRQVAVHSIMQELLTPRVPAPVSAHTILEQAASTIEQRGKDYNSPGGERSMKATVEAFNAITGLSVTPLQGWMFMTVLKLVRSVHSPGKTDTWIDLCGYSSLAGEEALNKEKE